MKLKLTQAPRVKDKALGVYYAYYPVGGAITVKE